MSNKAKTKSLNEDGQPALVPKLRFPEFRGAEGWVLKRLKDACDVNPANSAVPESFVYIDLESVEAGELKTRKIINRDEAPSRAQRLLRSGDVIFQIVRPYQRNNLHFKTSEGIGYVASTGYAQLRAKDSADFLFQAVHVDNFVDRVIAKCTGSSYPAINSSDLADVPFAIGRPVEQQKIADCLSSLDELIAAQARKVDALKTHKKGLMQQIFPSEGETQPRLRFPEFRDAGEWEAGNLGSKVSKVGSGITPTGGDTNYKQAGRPFVRSQNVGWGVLLLEDVAFIDEETHTSFSATEIKNLDVLLNITGASIGRSVVADQRIVGGNVNQHVCIIRVKPAELNPFFINQYLISQMGQAQIDSFQAGGNREGLNFAQIRSFFIPLPPNISEQQRIADCLTSLDTLITTGTQELETLKTHKKGLMQQLFPSTEEAPA